MMTDRKRFTWRMGSGTWELYYLGRPQPVVHVVPDDVHPSMWRVRLPDGQLSDMVNLSRARDAAIGVAFGIINRRAAA